MFFNNKRSLIVAFLVCIITILVYLPALQNDFVNWDDPAYVYENPHIQLIDLVFFKWIFTGFHAANWHPLTWLSHAVDYAVWGADPMGHHLTSMIIHGLNAFLVAIIAACLISVRRDPADRDHAPLVVGAVTGLLFGIHPLHVESVAWISERKDLLCAFFFLLSILSYLKYSLLRAHSEEEGHEKSDGKVHYVFSLFLFVLALMSKPMAVTLPVVLIILDLYPLERLSLENVFSRGCGVLIEKLPFFGLSIAASAITLMAQQKAMPLLEFFPIGTRICVGIRALGFYLVKMLFPKGLAPFYPHPREISFISFDYILAFLLVSGIIISCIWAFRRRQKFWPAVWAYYFVTLVPVLGIIQVGEQAAADRYTYLPGLGPMLLAGLGVFWLWRRSASDHIKRAVVAGFAILVLTVLSIMTTGQIAFWKDSISLWNRQLQLYTSAVAYNNRGEAYSVSGKHVKAIADFNKAIQLQPGDPSVYYNRGSVYKILVKYRETIADFNKAIELDPLYTQAYNNRGNVYLILEKYQEAMADFDKAIEIDPGHALAYNNRGNVFLRLGLYQKAEVDFNKSIELDPGYAPAYYNRGNVYLTLKIYQNALADYTKAVDLNPGYAQAYNNRGNIYLRLGKYQEAVADCTKAIELDPSYPFAYYNRALSYKKMGDTAKANTDFRHAARFGDKMSQNYLKSIGIEWR